jgi:hypothetical protein
MKNRKQTVSQRFGQDKDANAVIFVLPKSLGALQNGELSLNVRMARMRVFRFSTRFQSQNGQRVWREIVAERRARLVNG